jgi:organizing structure protein 2
MPYFLPKTAHNLRQYLSNVEDSRFPDFAAKHDSLNSNLETHWEMVKNRVGGAGKDVESWSRSAVEGIERGTGLKVADVVKRGQAAVDQIRDNADGKGVQYERVGYVVEQKPVAEIVRPVEPQSGRRAV